MNELSEPATSLQELFDRAETIKSAGDARGAAEAYARWIGQNPSHPQLFAVLFNYSAALTACGDLGGARVALERAIALNPDFVPPYINLGSLHEKLGAIDQAIFQWMAAVEKLGIVT